MDTAPKTSSSQSQFKQKLINSEDKVTKILVNKETQEKQLTDLKKKVKRQNYRWSPLEHHRYVTFLAENINLFRLSYQQKIKMKIQVMISNVVQQRNSYQCRSHHQKMLSKYGSIQNIINNHYELLKNASSAKIEQLADKSILHFKAEDGLNKRLGCKIQQQFENNNIHNQNGQQQYLSQLVLKEQDQVVYRTFT